MYYERYQTCAAGGALLSYTARSVTRSFCFILCGMGYLTVQGLRIAAAPSTVRGCGHGMCLL